MSGFAPFEIIPGDPTHALVILADHAMNRLPPEYGDLGLPAEAFSRHIAYDIGVEAVTRGSVRSALVFLGVLGCFSRLLIDPNRGEDDPTLIMKLSDGMVIPANHPLAPPTKRERRLNAFHRPYHDAVSTVIERNRRKSGKAPLVISMHSFTHAWKGVPRPWHAGFCGTPIRALCTSPDRKLRIRPGTDRWETMNPMTAHCAVTPCTGTARQQAWPMGCWKFARI
jgi:predicted N-formylglutamate amidohydrolase